MLSVTPQAGSRRLTIMLNKILCMGHAAFREFGIDGHGAEAHLLAVSIDLLEDGLICIAQLGLLCTFLRIFL